MAAGYTSKLLTSNFFKYAILSARCNLLHTSPVCCEVTSGRVKISPKRDKPVTYEQYFKPHDINRRKAWNSWNTSTIEGGVGSAEIALDDLFIRKFMEGTFPEMIKSEIIIKRQFNIIRIAFLLKPRLNPSGVCFLIGYSEKLLEYWLHSIVKLEIQVIKDVKQTVFKYI